MVTNYLRPAYDDSLPTTRPACGDGAIADLVAATAIIESNLATESELCFHVSQMWCAVPLGLHGRGCLAPGYPTRAGTSCVRCLKVLVTHYALASLAANPWGMSRTPCSRYLGRSFFLALGASMRALPARGSSVSILSLCFSAARLRALAQASSRHLLDVVVVQAPPRCPSPPRTRASHLGVAVADSRIQGGAVNGGDEEVNAPDLEELPRRRLALRSRGRRV